MDVLLVHYQPTTGGTLQTSVVATLAELASSHPHGMVPFLKVARKWTQITHSPMSFAVLL